MEYAEFISSVSDRTFNINGERYSYVQLENWVQESSDLMIEVQVKAVYKEFLFSNEDYISIKTSGSTGTPKLIHHQKEKVFNSARISNRFFDLKTGSSVLLVLPPDKIGGKMLIIRSIIGGMDLHYLTPKLDPLDKEKIPNVDFCSLTPAQLKSILQSESSHLQLKNITKVLIGGGAIDESLMAYIRNEKTDFFHSYGMTETISHVAVKKLNGKDATEYFEALEGIIFDKTKETNQLIIDAPGILDEKLLTNDIVKLDGAQRMKWMGRIDHVVNSGGIKLIVEELENKIRSMLPFDFYLTSEKDQILGEKLVMILSKADPLDEMELSSIFNKLLSKHERPKIIYRVKTIPVTSNGKIRRISPELLHILEKFSF